MCCCVLYANDLSPLGFVVVVRVRIRIKKRRANKFVVRILVLVFVLVVNAIVVVALLDKLAVQLRRPLLVVVRRRRITAAATAAAATTTVATTAIATATAAAAAFAFIELLNRRFDRLLLAAQLCPPSLERGPACSQPLPGAVEGVQLLYRDEMRSPIVTRRTTTATAAAAT